MRVVAVWLAVVVAVSPVEWLTGQLETSDLTPEMLAEYHQRATPAPFREPTAPPAQPAPPVVADPPPSMDRGMGSDVERWRPLVADHFDAGQVDTMMCIMAHESGGNPNAKNPRSSARGLFQILASLWAPHFGVSYDDLYDPGVNVRLARAIYDQQGYRAWSPYGRGLCRGL